MPAGSIPVLLRDVLPVDARAGIGVGQEVVRGVAVDADRDDRQAPLQEALAVDALGVVLEDLVLGDVVGLRDRRAFLVARPANERDAKASDARFGRLDGDDVVRSVTAGATRGQWRPGTDFATVQAIGIDFGDILVARRAIDLGRGKDLFSLRSATLTKAGKEAVAQASR